MNDINQAVILCGGLGTRLRPITNLIPKPMVKINKKPFLWYLMDKLSSSPNSIKKFLLLTGYKQDQIINYFKDGERFGWEIKYSCGDLSWETGKRIWMARNLIDSKFFLCYSDNFAQVSLKNLYEIWVKNNSVITLLLSNKENGNVKMQNKNNIKYLKKRKPGYNYVELGFMLCNKEYLFSKFSQIKENPQIDFSVILEQLSKENKISGYLINDNYHSIGDLLRLEKTRNYLIPKRILLLDRDGTINLKAKRGEYITSWRDFIFIRDTLNALIKLASEGFKFIIISNQAGVATGDLKIEDLISINKNMKNKLKEYGVDILDIFVSTDHWQSNSFRRKPNPGMFFEVSAKYNIRLDHTFYIGDDPRDYLAAKNASCGSILIGNDNYNDDITPDFKSEKLSNLTDLILKKFLEFENKYN